MSYKRINTIIEELDRLESEVKIQYKLPNYYTDILNNIIIVNKTSNTLIEEWVSISGRLRKTQ